MSANRIYKINSTRRKCYFCICTNLITPPKKKIYCISTWPASVLCVSLFDKNEISLLDWRTVNFVITNHFELVDWNRTDFIGELIRFDQSDPLTSHSFEHPVCLSEMYFPVKMYRYHVEAVLNRTTRYGCVIDKVVKFVP